MVRFSEDINIGARARATYAISALTLLHSQLTNLGV